MASLKGESGLGLTKVVAWREKGRWHVASMIPTASSSTRADVQGLAAPKLVAEPVDPHRPG